MLEEIQEEIRLFIEKYGVEPNVIFLKEDKIINLIAENFKHIINSANSIEAKPFSVFGLKIIPSEKYEGVGLIDLVEENEN